MFIQLKHSENNLRKSRQVGENHLLSQKVLSWKGHTRISKFNSKVKGPYRD